MTVPATTEVGPVPTSSTTSFDRAGKATRSHTTWTNSRGPLTGQNVLDDILTNPLTAERSYVHPSFGPVREFLLPDMGARFEEFGRLIGFL
jgi:hypothetical protein